MSWSNSFPTTKPSMSSEAYRNSPKRKMENANLVLYINADGTIEVGKNRYGQIGIISNDEGIETLINLLARVVFNDTCVIFQESLKKMIYKEIGGYKILEGKNNNIQKGKVL